MTERIISRVEAMSDLIILNIKDKPRGRELVFRDIGKSKILSYFKDNWQLFIKFLDKQLGSLLTMPWYSTDSFYNELNYVKDVSSDEKLFKENFKLFEESFLKDVEHKKYEGITRAYEFGHSWIVFCVNSYKGSYTDQIRYYFDIKIKDAFEFVELLLLCVYRLRVKCYLQLFKNMVFQSGPNHLRRFDGIVLCFNKSEEGKINNLVVELYEKFEFEKHFNPIVADSDKFKGIYASEEYDENNINLNRIKETLIDVERFNKYLKKDMSFSKKFSYTSSRAFALFTIFVRIVENYFKSEGKWDLYKEVLAKRNLDWSKQKEELGFNSIVHMSHNDIEYFFDSAYDEVCYAFNIDPKAFQKNKIWHTPYTPKITSREIKEEEKDKREEKDKEEEKETGDKESVSNVTIPEEKSESSKIEKKPYVKPEMKVFRYLYQWRLFENEKDFLEAQKNNIHPYHLLTKTKSLTKIKYAKANEVFTDSFDVDIKDGQIIALGAACVNDMNKWKWVTKKEDKPQENRGAIAINDKIEV